MLVEFHTLDAPDVVVATASWNAGAPVVTGADEAGDEERADVPDEVAHAMSRVESEAGPPRKYYRLTDAGRQALAELQGYWQHLTDTLNRLGK